jgi:PRTRC genetic system ThiF family protein
MSTINKKPAKLAVHIVEKELLQPYNPITVNLIGVGGTGGQMLTALARMNLSLIALGHPGLFVKAWDDDKVDTANLGRQLFTTAELGQFKSSVLINRINRFFDTNWKAVTDKYNDDVKDLNEASATIVISCVDTAKARFEIADLLANLQKKHYGRNRVKYWIDFENSRSSGQVVLSTIDKIKQPASELYRTIEKLALVTDEFKDLLIQSETNDTSPSCSLAEAFSKQDLFINSALTNCGASLLWQMFREGMIFNRGFFLNLKDFKTQPLKVA